MVGKAGLSIMAGNVQAIVPWIAYLCIWKSSTGFERMQARVLGVLWRCKVTLHRAVGETTGLEAQPVKISTAQSILA